MRDVLKIDDSYFSLFLILVLLCFCIKLSVTYTALNHHNHNRRNYFTIPKNLKRPPDPLPKLKHPHQFSPGYATESRLKKKQI